MSQPPPTVRVLFLGQCLQFGYDGVPRESAYPQLVRAPLGTRFPHLQVHVETRVLVHPRGLKALLRFRLAAFQPDIVVLAAIATSTATH